MGTKAYVLVEGYAEIELDVDKLVEENGSKAKGKMWLINKAKEEAIGNLIISKATWNGTTTTKPKKIRRGLGSH